MHKLKHSPLGTIIISVILPEKETNAWRSIEKLPEPRFGVSEARAHERKIRPSYIRRN